MKAVLLLFDSLNLRALSCYGGDLPTPDLVVTGDPGMVIDGMVINASRW